MKTSESIIKIAPALLEAQKEIGAAKKTGKNPFFHKDYATLGDVMEACKDTLNKHGITVLQPICGEFVETVLLHTSGEWLSSKTPIVAKQVNDPQAVGSAITYARRYGLQSMVFIPAEDDDAEKATNRNNQQSNTQQRKTSYTSDKKASEAQIKLISLLLSKKGQSDEALKKKYKVESKKDLTSAQASTIIDNLNNLPDVEDSQEDYASDY